MFLAFTYNGWGDIKTEQSHAGGVTTGTPAITYTYEDGADENGNALYVRLQKVTYPSGRQIHYCYEAPPTSRLSSISENSGGTQNLVAYTYLGMNTIVKESHPQVSGGLNLSYGSAGTYAGWDRFGRILQQLWKNDAGTTVDGYTYTYDRAGNRTSKTNTLNSAFSETYTYDDLNRLVDANRNGTNLQDWTLDALGNWGTFNDGSLNQTRTANAANEVTGISGSWIDPAYDAAGNMSSGPKAGDETTRLHFVYDAWNRLAAVKADDDGEPGATIATYAYDGMGRRVSKTVGSDTFDFYYNEQYQVVEVRKNGDTDPYEQTVYDVRYIDAPVMVYRDTDTDGSSIQYVYVAQDANFNVTAIIDGSNGSVINRFVYTPYGQRTVLNASWAAGTTDFMLGHQGLMLDGESGLYYNWARFYHPTLGRFMQRDPLEYVDGGNLYEYVRSSPIGAIDPRGLAVTPPPIPGENPPPKQNPPADIHLDDPSQPPGGGVIGTGPITIVGPSNPIEGLNPNQPGQGLPPIVNPPDPGEGRFEGEPSQWGWGPRRWEVPIQAWLELDTFSGVTLMSGIPILSGIALPASLRWLFGGLDSGVAWIKDPPKTAAAKTAWNMMQCLEKP